MQPPGKLAKRVSARRCARSSCTTWNSSGIAPATSSGTFARAAAAAGRTARREVSGRRAGRQVRVHRPHADDRAEGAGDQGGTGDDRQAAQATRRGDEDRPDRHHRHGGAGRSSPSRATSNSSAPCSSRSRTTCAQMAEQQGWSRARRGFQMTPKAYRLFQSQLLTRDLQQLQASRIRPAPGADRRRRRHRDAADQALRVRRLRRAHGHPALAGQRHAPRRPGPAGAAQARRHRHPPARATTPSAPRPCCST